MYGSDLHRSVDTRLVDSASGQSTYVQAGKSKLRPAAGLPAPAAGKSNGSPGGSRDAHREAPEARANHPHRIRARRVTGLSVQEQRRVAIAIKNAREVALLPYASTAR